MVGPRDVRWKDSGKRNVVMMWKCVWGWGGHEWKDKEMRQDVKMREAKKMG